MVDCLYWKWESVLSPELCQLLLSDIDWNKSAVAKIGGRKEADLKHRRTDVIWQNPMYTLGCIARTYMDVANQTAQWDFLINGQEETQLTRYRSENGGFYDWHVDSGSPKNGSQRKLTCVILLNDSSDFEGGELQLKGIEDNNVLTKQGSIVVFPSFIEHKVTPVTKGVRYTAVTWASGPAFR